MRQPKQRTPEEIKRRFRFALILVGVLVLGVGIMTKKEKSGNKTPGEEEIRAVLDAQLDSIIMKTYGEAASVITAGRFELVKIESDEEERLLEHTRNLEAARLDKNDEDIEYEEMMVKVLEEKISKRKSNEKNYYRPVKLQVPDSMQVFCLQMTDRNLKASELRHSIKGKNMTYDKNIEKEITKNNE